MVRFHAALGMTWKQRAHPCVSTGRSIHAVPSITPSPREGIEDPPSRPQATSGARLARWPRTRSPRCRAEASGAIASNAAALIAMLNHAGQAHRAPSGMTSDRPCLPPQECWFFAFTSHAFRPRLSQARRSTGVARGTSFRAELEGRGRVGGLRRPELRPRSDPCIVPVKRGWTGQSTSDEHRARATRMARYAGGGLKQKDRLATVLPSSFDGG
jgi:hypothetical protein